MARLDALQIELGQQTGRAKVERGEHSQEQMSDKAKNRFAGLVPESRPLNQGSVTRNGKKGRKL